MVVDDTWAKIIAGSASASGVIGLGFLVIKHLVKELKENRESGDKSRQEDRKIYLDSHQQTLKIAQEIALNAQNHLDDCHRDNRELSARQARLETRYADLSRAVVNKGLPLPHDTQGFID